MSLFQESIIRKHLGYLDQELVDQAEDTMTILSKYIDNLTINVEPVKLKSIMQELYVEALSTTTE